MHRHSTKHLNTQEFIEKAKRIHNDEYDYSEVKYINNHTKVKIKCKRCGEYFLQTPHAHLAHQGCMKCSIEKTHNKQRLKIEEFIKRAKLIHGENYDYSKTKYKSMNIKVTIICNRCKKEFNQTPQHHLRGQGCPYCRFQRQKENNLKKYGVENVFASECVKNKTKQTCLKRYGVEYVQQYQPFINTINATKLKNKTFNTSKDEEKIYQLLKEKFNLVERQYKSELYPFHCDFYIPKFDLYIEYQGTWTHHKHPFDKENLNDLILLNKWKMKNSKYYESAIKIWTIRDPLKREIAKKNNLNWLEFFNIQQFINWYNYF